MTAHDLPKSRQWEASFFGTSQSFKNSTFLHRPAFQYPAPEPISALQLLNRCLEYSLGAMSSTLSRSLLRHNRVARHSALRHASTTSEAASNTAAKSKETASAATSKASEGLSRVSSSAGSALGGAAQGISSSVNKLGGRLGRVVNFAQCKCP